MRSNRLSYRPAFRSLPPGCGDDFTPWKHEESDYRAASTGSKLPSPCFRPGASRLREGQLDAPDEVRAQVVDDRSDRRQSDEQDEVDDPDDRCPAEDDAG